MVLHLLKLKNLRNKEKAITLPQSSPACSHPIYEWDRTKDESDKLCNTIKPSVQDVQTLLWVVKTTLANSA